MKLYSYYRSSSAYRVRIAMNLKNLEYDIIPVHLLQDGGQQFSQQFSSINMAHKVPVLDQKLIFPSFQHLIGFAGGLFGFVIHRFFDW
ncbi:MAG: glutathione S-transferase N-terminal domain-containing protein, partial [Pseudomonadota bacterium]